MRLIIGLVLGCGLVYGQLPSTIDWDVRTTGSDTNGGGFNTVAAGTDRSQQNAAQVTIDNVTITATCNAAVITFTAGYTATAADVGNVVNIITSSGGTPATAGRYSISSQTATTWTLDRTTGAVTTTITSAKMGGSFATIAAALAAYSVGDQDIWVKLGSYTITVTLTTPAVVNTAFRNRLYGYNVSHNDNPTGANRPTITTNGAIVGITNTADGWDIANFIIDGNGGTRGTNGVLSQGNVVTFYNLEIKNFANGGFVANAASRRIIKSLEVHNNNVTGGTAGIELFSSSVNWVINCWVHDNPKIGIGEDQQNVISGNLITNNTGATSDGVFMSTGSSMVDDNTIYGNGGNGINSPSGFVGAATSIRNNILAKNGGFGINLSTNTRPDVAVFHPNAYWSNTSGATNKLNTTAADVLISGTAPTNDPFTNAAGSDWTLNNNAGAGALLRGTAEPGAVPGSVPTGKRDFGVFQSAGTGGGSSGPTGYVTIGYVNHEIYHDFTFKRYLFTGPVLV